MPEMTNAEKAALAAARVLKDYCDGRLNCKGCALENDVVGPCDLSCPCDWVLPDDEQEVQDGNHPSVSASK